MSTEENNQLNNEQSNFSLPGGYFQKSASSIINKIQRDEEQKAYPTLYGLKNKSGFVVPESYFSLRESHLELLIYPRLHSINKKQNFSTPPEYFEELEIGELTKVLSASENENAGFEKLSALPKLNSFKVNENYFKNNKVKLMTHLVKNKQGQVLHLFTSRMGFAAAALVMLALGLWVYSAFMKPVNNNSDCGTIACVDKIDVLESKSIDNLDDDDLYELVNPGDLKNKLENKGVEIKQDKMSDSSLKNINTDVLLDEI